MNHRERPRGLPTSVSPHKDRRPPGDPRNGPPPPMPMSVPTQGPSRTSRAERFEDEKRRIIQSCFAKKDPDGSVVESYITHIRIIEDGAHPSSPAPPDSPQENKKQRVIIVAVRKSGRVRMHKSRENSDGTFSIGKTWMLDDLTRIQKYDHIIVSSPAERQQKVWASNVGFTITITKPYYWQATTSKERDFFIGSIVKIFKKYTGGKTPELIGFDPHDRDVLTGVAAPGRPQHMHPPKSPGPGPGIPRSRSPSNHTNPSQSSYPDRAPSRDGPMEPRRQPSREQFLQNKPSHEQMQRTRPQYPTAQTSHSALPREQFQSKSVDPTASGPRYTPPPSMSADLSARKRADALGTDASPAQFPEQSSSPAPKNISPTVPVVAAPSDEGYFAEKSKLRNIPDRGGSPSNSEDISPGMLRPKVGSSKGSYGQKSVRSDHDEGFVTPLSSPKPSTVDARSPSKASNRSDHETRPRPSPLHALPDEANDDFKSGQAQVTEPKVEPSKPTQGVEIPRINTPDQVKSPPSGLETTDSTPVSPVEHEDHRPGLGPMVKAKGTKDVANAFRKAANAYGAFKPRAGGAAERLRAAKEKSVNGPDGITSVVPAPLLRRPNNDPIKSPSTKSIPKGPVSPTTIPTQEPPKVHVTDSTTGAEASFDDRREISPKTVPQQGGEEEEEEEEKEEELPRREDHTEEYCSSFGVDPVVLHGRGAYFDDILTDIGWDGRLPGDKAIEDLEADVRREIGRVQASSWLGHLQLQVGKVDQLAQLFDRTIEECDELDGLLTLYSHELGTLSDDVTCIESQARGLQTNIANQKLLQSEIQRLLTSNEGAI